MFLKIYYLLQNSSIIRYSSRITYKIAGKDILLDRLVRNLEDFKKEVEAEMKKKMPSKKETSINGLPNPTKLLKFSIVPKTKMHGNGLKNKKKKK